MTQSPFDNSLFNFSSSEDLFATPDTESNGLFDLPADDNVAPQEEAPETDLFGEPVVEAKEEEPVKPAPATPTKAAPVKAEAEKPAANTSALDKNKTNSASSDKPKPKPAKKDNKDIKVGPTWTIAYAAQTFIPDEVDMSLDQVTEMMARDYPEFSPERIKWEVDEEQHILVPIVKGGKMG